MNIVKFLRAAFFLQNISDGCFWSTRFFISNAFFQLSLSVAYLQVLLLGVAYYILHIAVIILRHILYLVYLCPCLGLGQFMSCLCDLFFIFSLIFVIIDLITSFKQMYLFFAHFLEYLLVFLEKVRESFSIKSSASGCYLALA